MHTAAPVQAPDGVRPAPSLHRLGPLFGDVVLGEPLKSADELAVHEPGRERIEVTGDRRHSHLVEQRQAVRDVAVQDAQPSRRHPPDRACRGVARGTDVDGALGPLPSAVEVACEHPLVRAHDRDPGVSGRLVVTVEQALRPGQPAAHRCHQRGVHEQVHRDANRRARRRHRVAGLDAQRVRTLVRLDGHVEMAGRVGDLREQREIARAQESIRVGLHEQHVALIPVAARRRFSRALQAHRTPP